MSGADLAAAFTQRRTSSRRSPAPAPVKAEEATPSPTATEPAAETHAAEVPAAEAIDGTNAASPTTTDEAQTETTGEATNIEQPTSNAEQPTEGEAIAAETTATPEPEQPVQKRINELTAKFREEERKRLAAEAKLAEVQATPEQPKPVAIVAGEFGHDPEVRQLSTQLDAARAVERWLVDNPEGGEVTNARGEVVVTLTADQAAAERARNAEQLNELRVLKSLRVRELKAHRDSVRHQAEGMLKKQFTWAAEASSPQMETIRQLEQLVPELSERVPGWKLWAAHGITGMERSMAGPKPLPKPAAVPPKVAVPSGAAAPKVDPVAKELRAAEAAFAKSGRPEEYQRVQSLRRQLNRRPQ
jgi:hypothetical protein